MLSRPTDPTASAEKEGIPQASSLAVDDSRNVFRQNSVAKYPSPPTQRATPSRWDSSALSARALRLVVVALWLNKASLTSKKAVRTSASAHDHVLLRGPLQ